MAPGLHLRVDSIAALTTAFLFASRVIASPALVTTIIPQSHPKLAVAAGITICDGGHGVYWCTNSHRCFWDQNGAFACCPTSSHSVSCIGRTKCYDKDSKGKTCGPDDAGCIDCKTHSSNPYCFTHTNPVMQRYGIGCDTKPGTSTSSFSFFTNAPSTLVGLPPQITSDPVSPSPTSVVPSSIADGSAAPTTTMQKTALPKPTSPEEDTGGYHGLPGSSVGGIVVGSVAGIAVISLAIFLLFKWYKDRKNNQDSGTSAALSGLRKDAKKKHQHSSGGIHSNSNDTAGNPAHGDLLQSPVLTYHEGHSTSSLPTVNDTASPGKTYPHSASSINTYPQESELAAFPSPGKMRSSEVPFIVHSSTQGHDNSSPPLTTLSPTLLEAPNASRPVSANWPLPAGGLPSQGSSGLPVSDEEQERRRKSSQMLSSAGPFLSAEQALGEGYWEAEREQLEADRRMREETKGEASANTDEEIEVNETGTVVRRRSKK